MRRPLTLLGHGPPAPLPTYLRACRPGAQGALAALKWEHVSVADSLAMGDAAVRMAEAGVSSVACLGVDFMAESVRATLDSRGFQGVPVSQSARGGEAGVVFRCT